MKGPNVPKMFRAIQGQTSVSFGEYWASKVVYPSGELTKSNGIDGHRNSGFSHE